MDASISSPLDGYIFPNSFQNLHKVFRAGAGHALTEAPFRPQRGQLFRHSNVGSCAVIALLLTIFYHDSVAYVLSGNPLWARGA